MGTPGPATVRFCPSRVEGHEGVVEVEISTSGVTLVTDTERRDLPWETLGRAEGWIERFMRTLVGGRKRLGERNFFADPGDRFFRFHAEPPITIYMPREDTPDGSTFRKVRQFLDDLGYETADLG